jgi:endo-1,4-beta-xylanase
VPRLDRNPLAALGLALAAADWSGQTGAVDLSGALPKLPLTPVRLVLPQLPGGQTTDTLTAAVPAGLTLRPGTALLLAGVLADGRILLGVADPARQVARHPRLELAVLTTATLAPLLALAGASLDPSGSAVTLPGGTSVPLAPIDPALAARLVTGAGILFVDQVPLQPKGTKTPLLTAEPVVPAPDASVAPGFALVSQAKDGRILALDSAGKAIGRAQHIGGDVAWNWLGKDGLELALRELADRIGWRVGTEKGDFQDPVYRSVDVAQCNQITIGTYWFEIEPEPDRFNFSIARSQLGEIAPYGFRVRGHPVVDNGSDVAWLSGLSETRIREALVRHVSTIVGEFEGAVSEWVVVNEPYLPPYRPVDPFHAALGYEYIDLAFATARKTDPAAVLIYNDTENHTADGLTTALTRETVRRLHKKGLIDMVGLQMHLDGSYPPDPADVIATMRSYGLPVAITEFDIDLSTIKGSTAERFAVQARIAASVLGAVRDSGVCKSFTLWGLGDHLSWLVAAMGKPRAAPTPFDDNLKLERWVDELRRVDAGGVSVASGARSPARSRGSTARSR